eukprot:3432234-Pleurochrysis_carterae.AAC.2
MERIKGASVTTVAGTVVHERVQFVLRAIRSSLPCVPRAFVVRASASGHPPFARRRCRERVGVARQASEPAVRAVDKRHPRSAFAIT